MKKLLSVLLSVCMLLCLAACNQNTEAPPETNPTTEAQSPTEPQPTTENVDNQDGDPTDTVRPLTLEKSLYTYYEWADDYDPALVRSEHSTVTLSQEAAEDYPEMAQVLSQIATMQENAMLDEFDNLISFAKEELDADRDSFVTNVSTLDVQVRRADSLVISLLSDSYSHYGQIENCRVFHGSNYDTQSGRELMLNDVVTVNNDLAQAVETELTTSMWAGDFYSETAVEIPLDISFFAELDADEDLEAISVSGWYNDERNHYMDYGIYTETDGHYFEECFVYDFHPYYVKTADGNYVYLFCEDFDEGVRQMKLTVFSLNADGSVTKLGERNVSPSWLADNKFIVPTDPGCLLLDDLDHETDKAAL